MLYHGSLVHSIMDVDHDLKVVETTAGTKRVYECEPHPLLRRPLGLFYSYTVTDPLAIPGERDLLRIAMFVPRSLSKEERAKLLSSLPEDQHDEVNRLLEKTCQLVVALQKERSSRQTPVFSEDVTEDLATVMNYFALRGQGGSREVMRSEGQLEPDVTGRQDPLPVTFALRFEPVSATHTLVHVNACPLHTADTNQSTTITGLFPTYLLECAWHDIHRTANGE